MVDEERDPFKHPTIWLLAKERTGWRRWVFGRWVHNSEPFRRDIQRACARIDFTTILGRGERLYDPNDHKPGDQ